MDANTTFVSKFRTNLFNSKWFIAAQSLFDFNEWLWLNKQWGSGALNDRNTSCASNRIVHILTDACMLLVPNDGTSSSCECSNWLNTPNLCVIDVTTRHYCSKSSGSIQSSERRRSHSVKIHFWNCFPSETQNDWMVRSMLVHHNSRLFVISWTGTQSSSRISGREHSGRKCCVSDERNKIYWFWFSRQIFGAIAVPLSDRKNVFVSYNFEANYNSPFMASDFYPGFLNRVSIDGHSDVMKPQSKFIWLYFGVDQFQLDIASESKATKTRRSLVTRTNVYKVIEGKLKAYVTPTSIQNESNKCLYSSSSAVLDTMDTNVCCVPFAKRPIHHLEWIMAS